MAGHSRVQTNPLEALIREFSVTISFWIFFPKMFCVVIIFVEIWLSFILSVHTRKQQNETAQGYGIPVFHDQSAQQGRDIHD